MTTQTTNAEALAAAFVGVLRGVGLEVSLSRSMGFVEALSVIDITSADAVFWAGRATLTSHELDAELYDTAFAVFWGGLTGVVTTQLQAPPPEIMLATDDEDDESSDDGDESTVDGPIVEVRWSAVEVLRHKDFSECSDDELEQLHQLMVGLRWTAQTRPSRRLKPTRRRTRRPDLNRTVRLAMSTGGEPIRMAYKDTDRRPRRLVLLVDVSGSMESYARALLRFAHAAVVGRARVEAFTIGTRLTRVTRELQSRDPDAALKAAGASVQDWSGGTRLGDTLRVFNDEWGVRGMARGANVVILSDGWDRGESDELAAQMERLHRVTHQLIWVNPLKYTTGYAPLAKGMAAALPHVDSFVEGHAYESLERLAAVIGHR